MPAIVGDSNIQGQVKVLVAYLERSTWQDVWNRLHLPLLTFPEVGLEEDSRDSFVWEVCQREQIVLGTGNRNADGPDSLEATLRSRLAADSLPVFTISDPQRFLSSRDYAEKVAERLLDYLLDLDNCRGTGRLYLP